MCMAGLIPQHPTLVYTCRRERLKALAEQLQAASQQAKAAEQEASQVNLS